MYIAEYDTGGNPSAEEVEEALENGASQVNNVVHSFRLQSTSFDKKVSQFPSMAFVILYTRFAPQKRRIIRGATIGPAYANWLPRQRVLRAQISATDSAGEQSSVADSRRLSIQCKLIS